MEADVRLKLTAVSSFGVHVARHRFLGDGTRERLADALTVALSGKRWRATRTPKGGVIFMVVNGGHGISNKRRLRLRFELVQRSQMKDPARGWPHADLCLGSPV